MRFQTDKNLTKKPKVLSNQLPVMEAFYTIQGEGFHSGKASYFIRLAGCDVGCFWCDVKDSWDAKKHPAIRVEKIVQEAIKHPSRMAVITGGEPLMHDLTLLTNALKSAGFEVFIETSGAYPLSGDLDWICVSPKKFKKALPSVFAHANELKVVIYNKNDFDWAIENAQFVNSNCKLFLQPEWSKQNKMLPQIIDFIKQNPAWQISLQSHKFMNIP